MHIGSPQKEETFPLSVLPKDWQGQDVDTERDEPVIVSGPGEQGTHDPGMRDLFQVFPLLGDKLIPETDR